MSKSTAKETRRKPGRPYQRSHLEPVRIGWAVGRNPNQVFNRRWFMKPGFEMEDPVGLGTDQVRTNPPSVIPSWIDLPDPWTRKYAFCRSS